MKLSLRAKTAVMLLTTAFVLIAAAAAVSYSIYTDRMFSYYEETAEKLTKTMADTIDMDQIRTLSRRAMEIYREMYEETGGVPKEMDEAYYARYAEVADSEEYKSIMCFLQKLGETNEVASIYICYMDRRTNQAVYIIDGSTEEDACPMGTCDPIEENNLALMNDGCYDFPSYITNYAEYGWLCSASAAIRGAGGQVLGNAYVDVSMDEVILDRINFLKQLCLVLLLAAGVMTAVMILLVNRSIVSPINLLSAAAGRFVEDKEAHGDEEDKSAIEKLDIQTGDEIQALSEAIKQMERDLNTYIGELTAVTAEKERIGAELDVAKHIQSSMLPCIFPAFPEHKEFDIHATMTPAKEVGGDFYDFFMVDERHLAIVMADVSGKGVPAALFMVIAKTLIKDHTQPEEDLGRVFTQVNNMLCESNSEGLFVTAFEGVLDLCTGEFRFVNAGHEIPYIYKKGEGFAPYKVRAGFVLAGMEDMKYRSGVLTLDVGDKLFQYTDGVTEATDVHNELYGDKRLSKVLNENAEAAPAAILQAVKADIDAFAGEAPQFDDITMLCLEYKERMPVLR